MTKVEIEDIIKEYLVNKMQIYISKDEGYLKVELWVGEMKIDADTL